MHLLLGNATTTPVSPWVIAMFAFLSAQCALIIPLYFQAKNKVKEAESARTAKIEEARLAQEAKEKDWARQDEVARRAEEAQEKVAEAARLLLERQQLDSFKTAEAARLLLAANERVAKSSGEMNGKLDVIHDLVNSKMTEAMQGQLDETIRSLASLREIVDLKRAASKEPSKESLGVIKATEERISELKAQMDDRLKQQATIDAQKQAIVDAQTKK